MSEQSIYEQFKGDQLGQTVLEVPALGLKNPYGVECTTLVWLYANFMFPGVSMTELTGETNAAQMFNAADTNYFEKITNNHNDPNQIPLQGDIMVFGPTPETGYTNTFHNPDGHCGVCDSANSNGYALLQQNAPQTNEHVNVTFYLWKFRPCLGWLHPLQGK